MFNGFLETPFAHSRKPWGAWAQYVECMLEGKTLRECAAEVGITLRTAFRWRHVIMDALRQMDEGTRHKGLVEAEYSRGGAWQELLTRTALAEP